MEMEEKNPGLAAILVTVGWGGGGGGGFHIGRGWSHKYRQIQG